MAISLRAVSSVHKYHIHAGSLARRLSVFWIPKLLEILSPSVRITRPVHSLDLCATSYPLVSPRLDYTTKRRPITESAVRCSMVASECSRNVAAHSTRPVMRINSHARSILDAEITRTTVDQPIHDAVWKSDDPCYTTSFLSNAGKSTESSRYVRTDEN